MVTSDSPKDKTTRTELKELELHKETIRDLTEEETSKVRGGVFGELEDDPSRRLTFDGSPGCEGGNPSRRLTFDGSPGCEGGTPSQRYTSAKSCACKK